MMKLSPFQSDSENARYEFADQEVLAETGEKFRKTSLRMLTPEEIRCELEEEFSQLPPPVTVVFANKRCRACGQTGDPRLMKDMCHRNSLLQSRSDIERLIRQLSYAIKTQIKAPKTP